MPITINGETAIWIYNPCEWGEEDMYDLDDQMREVTVNKLIIASKAPLETDVIRTCLTQTQYITDRFLRREEPDMPYYYPVLQPMMLKAFDTGRVVHLELIGLDLTNMPRIPESVRRLVITHSKFTHLTQINANWTRITELEVSNNTELTDTSLDIPTGVRLVNINKQHLNVIRFPETMNSVSIRCSTFKKISGFLPLTKFICINTESPYRDALRSIQCKHLGVMLNRTAHQEAALVRQRHQQFIQCISDINHAENYQMYDEFRLVPKRVVYPYIHREEPIVAALFLSSNIVRRAAEFMTETTILR